MATEEAPPTRASNHGGATAGEPFSASTRRSSAVPDDNWMVGTGERPEEVLLALYDRALPIVYGYLVDRCRDRPTAEDLTSETFLAVARAVHEGSDTALSVPWIVGVARHKLADHWRRRARDERLLEGADATEGLEDPWDAHLDAMRAVSVLDRLGGHHRAALTLRYVDGLSVPEVAELLGRTIHATEALLVRARATYRRLYEEGEGDE